MRIRTARYRQGLMASLAVTVITAITAFAAAPLSAQRGDTFSESVDVEVVNVDVMVTTKDGQPVNGLTRADFEVFEDGQSVTLTNFYAADGPAIRLGSSDELPPDDAEPAATGDTQGLQLVVFVDNLNIRPQNRKLLFENLRRQLEERAVPGSQVMLVTMNNRIEVVQPFTSDPELVLSALGGIEKQTSLSVLMDGDRRMYLAELGRASLYSVPCNRTRRIGAPGSGGGGGASDPQFDEAVRTAQTLAIRIRSLAEQRYQAARGTVSSLAAFSDTLGGLPGRKAVLYLSDGISMRPADSLIEAWIGKYQNWFQGNETAIRNCSRYPEAVGDLQRTVTSAGSNNFDLHRDFNRLTERASSNRVAFYPISNGGRQAGLITAAIGGSTDGTSGQAMRNAMIAETYSRNASILQMADDTGGQAVTGNANVGKLLEKVGRDFSSYYSLGYAPPDREGDAGFRKIEVKVRRDGIKVRHVKGHRASNWQDRLGEMTVASALYQLESNPLGIQLETAEPVRQGGRFKVPILVKIPFSQVRMESAGDHYQAHLALMVVVLDEKGGFSPPRTFDLPIQVPNAQILQARQQDAAYPIELEMKKGAQRVGVGVRDHLAQTSSCLKLDFELGASEKKGKKGKKRKARG